MGNNRGELNIMSNYTKGEWKINDMPLPSSGYIRIEANYTEIAQIHKPKGKAKYYGLKMLPDEISANCNLISSAPDMYEALKEADAIIISLCLKLNPTHILKQCKTCPDRKSNSILNAIRKAEGKC